MEDKRSKKNDDLKLQTASIKGTELELSNNHQIEQILQALHTAAKMADTLHLHTVWEVWGYFSLVRYINPVNLPLILVKRILTRACVPMAKKAICNISETSNNPTLTRYANKTIEIISFSEDPIGGITGHLINLICIKVNIKNDVFKQELRLLISDMFKLILNGGKLHEMLSTHKRIQLVLSISEYGFDSYCKYKIKCIELKLLQEELKNKMEEKAIETEIQRIERERHIHKIKLHIKEKEKEVEIFSRKVKLNIINHIEKIRKTHVSDSPEKLESFMLNQIGLIKKLNTEIPSNSQELVEILQSIITEYRKNGLFLSEAFLNFATSQVEDQLTLEQQLKTLQGVLIMDEKKPQPTIEDAEDTGAVNTKLTVVNNRTEVEKGSAQNFADQNGDKQNAQVISSRAGNVHGTVQSIADLSGTLAKSVASVKNTERVAATRIAESKDRVEIENKNLEKAKITSKTEQDRVEKEYTVRLEGLKNESKKIDKEAENKLEQLNFEKEKLRMEMEYKTKQKDSEQAQKALQEQCSKKDSKIEKLNAKLIQKTQEIKQITEANTIVNRKLIDSEQVQKALQEKLDLAQRNLTQQCSEKDSKIKMLEGKLSQQAQEIKQLSQANAIASKKLIVGTGAVGGGILFGIIGNLLLPVIGGILGIGGGALAGSVVANYINPSVEKDKITLLFAQDTPIVHDDNPNSSVKNRFGNQDQAQQSMHPPLFQSHQGEKDKEKATEQLEKKFQ